MSTPEEQKDPRYRAGFEAGFHAGQGIGYQKGAQDARDEANRDWRERTSQVMLGSTLINALTAAERKAVRVEILLQGHEAGFHGTIPRADCPECSRDSQSKQHHNGHYGVPPCGPACARLGDVEHGHGTAPGPAADCCPSTAGPCDLTTCPRRQNAGPAADVGQPAACTEHVVNQLSCPVCSALRTAFYRRLAEELGQ